VSQRARIYGDHDLYGRKKEQPGLREALAGDRSGDTPSSPNSIGPPYAGPILETPSRIRRQCPGVPAADIDIYDVLVTRLQKVMRFQAFLPMDE
jgi:hypothetical protein